MRVSHSKTAEGCTDDPKSPDLDSRLAHRVLLPLVGVGIVIVGLVSANIWWLLTNRRGLPPNIDEAGYLQRTVQFGQDLSNHGISGIVHYWTTPDTTGPLLIAVSGTIRSATGLNAFGLLCTEQIPFAATIVGVYLLARQICGRWMALACATLVACMPGLLDAGRLYILAEPATALFILLVVAQLRAGRFDSIWRTLLWGLLVGLTALTRTMMIAVLVGPVAVAGLHWITSRPNRRQTLNLAAGAALALVVAGSWYWFSWSTVYTYLTQYGYGAAARNYGAGRPILSWGWWLNRLNNLVNQDLYFPLLCVLVVALLLLALQSRSLARLSTKLRPGVQKEAPDGIARKAKTTARANSSLWRRKVLASFNRVSSFLDRPVVQIAAILVVSYLVLSSSQNGGSYFELPLAPVLVCAVVAPVARIHISLRAIAIGSVLVASVLAAVDQFGEFRTLANNQNVSVGPAHMVAFNAANYYLIGPNGTLTGSIAGVYWTNCGRATITCFYGRQSDISVSYLKSWSRLNAEVEHFVYDYSAEFKRSPVIFFAYQGPFLNTNFVQLVAQQHGSFLPEGVLLPPQLRDDISLVQQLELPRYGQPNFVIAGVPPSRGARTYPGSSVGTLERVQRTLVADGFRRVKTVSLPYAEALGVWFKDR